jgi:excisionase family DNA binding protein
MNRSEDGSETTLLCVEAREAAGMLRVSRRAVRNLVARGQLEARRDGDGAKILIPLSSLQKLRSEWRREG